MAQTYININGESRDASSITVPADRTFRGAWQFNGDVVEVDMASAREVHKGNLRTERQSQLDSLDTAWFRAAEQSDANAQADVAAQKQALRDVTADARIESAATPEALKVLTLDVLLK